MGQTIGSLALPSPQRTSQLVNDTRFSSIQEYVLDSSSLSGSTQLDISDLSVGSVIYQVELMILSAFSESGGSQPTIEITCDNGGVLMDDTWNDPTTVAVYSTDCYTSIRTVNDLVHIIHNLSNITAGSAILRLYLYKNEST